MVTLSYAAAVAAGLTAAVAAGYALASMLGGRRRDDDNEDEGPITISRPSRGRLPYSHGGWFGASALFRRGSTSPLWRALLRELTPVTAARVEAVEAVGGKGASARVAFILENNPVMAAFGASHCGLTDDASRPAMEFDSFLPKPLCDAVDAAARSGDRVALDAAGAALARAVLVQHGTLGSFAREFFLGVPQYDTLGAAGAQTIEQWLACFVAALERAAAAGEAGARQLLASGSSGVPCLSVFLDVKSPRASGVVLAALVRALNYFGLHVWGVGAFRHAQLHELDPLLGAQQIVQLRSLAAAAAAAGDPSPPAPATTAASLPRPRLIYLAGSIGDVQRFALGDAPSIPRGASVIFNGGSILKASSGTRPWEIDSSAVAAARHLVRTRGLLLGGYIQEPRCDSCAADLLVSAFDDASIFKIGLTYSNLPGTAELSTPRGNGFDVKWPLSLLFGRKHLDPSSFKLKDEGAGSKDSDLVVAI